ncbi:MAG TPA: hypothetical protein ENK50_08620 [Sedimenticola sp.]|nr:hypothetical protein [Sedimenticola sp.]
MLFRILALLLALLPVAGNTLQAAEIRARVSPSQPVAGEPFVLILESNGTPAGEPDLSPLQGVFEILHRSRSQRTRSHNGRVTRQTTWRLTLRDPRGNARRIPAIAFGRDHSNPVPLSTLTPPTNAPGGRWPPAVATPSPPDMTARPGGNRPPAAASRRPAAPPDRAFPAPPPGTTPRARKDVPAGQPVTPPRRTLAGLLLASVPGLVLLLTWGWQWQRHRQRRWQAPAEEQPPEASPEAQALREACRRNDPEAAARALLEWAGRRWPESPPTGIGPLARRFAGTDVEDALRSLDQVLYAPGEKQWEGSRLWQVMEKLMQAPEPGSRAA